MVSELASSVDDHQLYNGELASSADDHQLYNGELASSADDHQFDPHQGKIKNYKTSGKFFFEVHYFQDRP